MTLDVVLSLVAEAVAVAEATGVLDEVLGHTSFLEIDSIVGVVVVTAGPKTPFLLDDDSC